MRGWMGGKRRRIAVERRDPVARQRQFFAQRREQRGNKQLRLPLGEAADARAYLDSFRRGLQVGRHPHAPQRDVAGARAEGRTRAPKRPVHVSADLLLLADPAAMESVVTDERVAKRRRESERREFQCAPALSRSPEVRELSVGPQIENACNRPRPNSLRRLEERRAQSPRALSNEIRIFDDVEERTPHFRPPVLPPDFLNSETAHPQQQKRKRIESPRDSFQTPRALPSLKRRKGRPQRQLSSAEFSERHKHVRQNSEWDADDYTSRKGLFSPEEGEVTTSLQGSHVASARRLETAIHRVEGADESEILLSGREQATSCFPNFFPGRNSPNAHSSSERPLRAVSPHAISSSDNLPSRTSYDSAERDRSLRHEHSSGASILQEQPRHQRFPAIYFNSDSDGLPSQDESSAPSPAYRSILEREFLHPNDLSAELLRLEHVMLNDPDQDVGAFSRIHPSQQSTRTSLTRQNALTSANLRDNNAVPEKNENVPPSVSEALLVPSIPAAQSSRAKSQHLSDLNVTTSSFRKNPLTEAMAGAEEERIQGSSQAAPQQPIRHYR